MTDVYQTIMTNFGIEKYSGSCHWIAMSNAEVTGFECTILKNGKLVSSYSPISGWKHYNA